MSDVFTECILFDKVNLRPSDLYDEPREVIINILKDRYEAKCSRHGYIRKGSVKIHKMGLGSVQMVSLNGDILYTVEFCADVCLPVVGNVLKATVKNMNRFGVLCEVTKDKDVVMEIIVAKNSPEIHSEVNLEEVKVGDVVNIEVVGRKFELNDKKISIIGRIVMNFKQNRIVQRAQALVFDPPVIDELDSDVRPGDDDGSDEEKTSSEEESSEDEEESSSSSEEEESDDAGEASEGDDTGVSEVEDD